MSEESLCAIHHIFRIFTAALAAGAARPFCVISPPLGATHEKRCVCHFRLRHRICRADKGGQRDVVRRLFLRDILSKGGGPMPFEMKPLACDPKRLRGLSEKLIVSHTRITMAVPSSV